MAGDWIKIEHTTPDKPEVVRMAALLRIDQDAVVGKLIRIWIWADQNSVSGTASGVTDAFIDRLTARRGFASAMRAAGWLTGLDDQITLTNFARNNGASAKARAMDNRKKASQRQRGECPDNVPLETGQTPGQTPGPEKRREEKSINTIHTPCVAGGAGGSPSAPPADTPEALPLLPSGEPPRMPVSAAPARPTRLPDGEWLTGLKADPAFAGIDIELEHAKATRWCAEHRKILTRQRLINWLNRCDRPLAGTAAEPRGRRATFA